MLDGLVNLLKEFFAWMWNWVIDWLQTAFVTIAAYLERLASENGLQIDPTELTQRIETLSNLLQTVNQWLPIEAVLGMVTVEWSLRLSMRAVRWIIGFIPTVEG